MLSTLDLSLIFIYFAILVWVGYSSSRKQEDEDFLLAKRNLGMWRTMFTVNATKMGTILMAFTAFTYIWGFSAVWYFIGVILGMIIFLPFALRLYKLSGGKYYTLADYFKYNYGKGPAKFASSIGIILNFGFLIISLIAVAKIFIFFTGWPFWISAVLTSSIILIYITLAGFRAVVKTDIIQYTAMMVIMLLMVIILFDGNLLSSIELNIFSGGGASVFAFLLVGVLSAFAVPEIWQRVYSSKGLKEFKKGWLISVTIYIGMVFLLTITALTVRAKFPLVDPDIALIYGFANLLPPGLIGLSIILLFAAIMSSLDTYLFTTTSSVIQDFFSFSTKKKTVQAMKKTSIILTVIAVLIAIAIQDIVISSYVFASFMIVLSIPVLATWINKDVSKKTLTGGFVFGLLALITAWTYMAIIGRIEMVAVIAVLAATILGLFIGKISKFFN